MKNGKKLITSIFSLLLINSLFAQKIVKNSFIDSQQFNVGMFSVVGNNPSSPYPGTEEFRNELRTIRQGTDNEYIAINSLHTYGHFISDSVFWTKYLGDISSVSDSLKTLGDCNFDYIDTNGDSIISQDELDTFSNLFESFITYPNTDHILGWYIIDEPSARGFNPAEVNIIYNTIKQRDSRPIYIAEAPSQPDYSRFLCDVLMIDDYYYTVNDFGDFFTLSAWKYLLTQAHEQLINAGRGETKIQAILVLGEEIYPDSLNEEYMESHGLTHLAIRTVLDLGVSGVWFYAWRAGAINEEDAVDRWLSRQNYAEAIESEFHDRDFLVTAFNGNTSKIVISDLGNDQSPGDGIEFDFDNKISALASGDFQGSNDLEGHSIFYDLSYRLEEGYRSNGDGDDELITAFDNGDVYFNENGNKPDQSQIGSNQGNILATTSGDFDGDGDFELVTAMQSGGECKIYVSDDAKEGSVMQYQVYSSPNFRVTALAAGDFNGDGRDVLVTAVSNSQFTESYIYVDDISSTGNAVQSPPWFVSDNEFHVSALTAGDFTDDNIYRDRLIFALSDKNLSNTRIYCSGLDTFSFDSSTVFYGPDNDFHVTAMTFGDFSDDNKITQELVIALSNNTLDQTKIYTTDDPIKNGIGSVIYNPVSPTNYYVSAITSASFRESLHPITSVEEDQRINNTKVEKFTLFQNFPNPFNPETTIKYQVAEPAFVTIKVYDALGREIVTLVNENKQQGIYEIVFSANSGSASNLPSGVYFCRLQAGRFVQVKKMLLLK